MLKLKEEKVSTRPNGPRENLYDVGDGRKWWDKFQKLYGVADKETKSFVFHLPRELSSIISKRKENPHDAKRALTAILQNDHGYEAESRSFKYFKNNTSSK